jgi:hypothetical protein
MAESFKEILVSMKEIKEEEKIDQILREKIGIGFSECAQALSDSLIKRMDEVVNDLPSLAPNGDYSILIEDKALMAKFLQEEAVKPEHWKFEIMSIRKDTDQLLEIMFLNDAVDDGDLLKGFVFLGISGKIRHAFAQVHT